MIKKKHLKQNIFKPEYLFHGTPFVVNVLEKRQSHDNVNKNNEDTAVFLTSSFITAAAYAFRNKIKEVNDEWSFSINNKGEFPAMVFEAKYIPDDLYGYIYVFKKDSTMIKDEEKNTTQYRCYHDLPTVDVIKVFYKDFEKYFERKIK